MFWGRVFGLRGNDCSGEAVGKGDRLSFPLAPPWPLRPRWRQGEQWRGPCPLHGSRSATSRVFAAHLGKNLFHCFRCGAGGNALDLWAALSRLPLHAAVLDLCQRLHQDVPWLDNAQPARSR